MKAERIAQLRAEAENYKASATKLDPCGYADMSARLTECLDEIEKFKPRKVQYELLRDANAIVRVERDWWQKAASASVADESPIQINLVPNCSNTRGHTWDLDADGMECQHCGYFAPGLTTP